MPTSTAITASRSQHLTAQKVGEVALVEVHQRESYPKIVAPRELVRAKTVQLGSCGFRVAEREAAYKKALALAPSNVTAGNAARSPR
mgnify:CR=1 FL=1